jgi:hypothetical protein
MLKNIFPIGIHRVIDARPQSQLHTLSFQLIRDGSGIGDGPCQPVELRHDQRVSGADCRHRLVETWASAVGARETLVHVDAILGHPEGKQRLPLGGEVLPVCGAAGVADEGMCHAEDVTYKEPLLQIKSYYLNEIFGGLSFQQDEQRQQPVRTPR